jgi:hypothetical protein
MRQAEAMDESRYRLWWPWLVASGMLLSTIIIWAPHVDARAVWRDEAATLIFASFSPDELWLATSHVDRTMAPYYLLVSSLPHSPVALRWVSLIAGALAIAITAWLATRWWSTSAGLAVGLFLVVNPLLTPYFLEARSYTLTVVFLMMSTALLMADQMPQVGRWVLYTAALTMAILMNMLVAPAVLVHVIYVALRVRPKDWWAPLLAWATAAGPALGLLFSSAVTTGQLAWLSLPTPRSITAMYAAASGGPWFWLLVGLSMVGLSKGRWRLNGEPFLGGALIIVPVLANLLVSYTVAPIFYPRYMLIVTCGFALLLGAGTSTVGKHRVAIAAVLVSAALAATMTWLDHEPLSTPQADLLLAGLANGAEVGDVLVVDQAFTSTGHIGAVALALGDESLWQRARDLALVNGPDATLHGRITSIEADRITTEPVSGPGTGTAWTISSDPLDGCAVQESLVWGGYQVHRQDCHGG